MGMAEYISLCSAFIFIFCILQSSMAYFHSVNSLSLTYEFSWHCVDVDVDIDVVVNCQRTVTPELDSGAV